MKVLSLLSLLSTVLILGSCQKDDSTNTTTKTKTELITLKAWKYNDAKIDTDNNGTGDQAIPAGVIEPCQTDNAITFTTNGSGTIDEGPTKCDAGDPQSIPLHGASPTTKLHSIFRLHFLWGLAAILRSFPSPKPNL